MNPLAQYLQQNKISQVEFARRVGVTPTYIHMIAKGLRQPSKRLAMVMEQVSNGKLSRLALLYPESPKKGCPARGRSTAEVPDKAQSQ